MSGTDNRARRLAAQRAANARRAQPQAAPLPSVPYHPRPGMHPTPGMRPPPSMYPQPGMRPPPGMHPRPGMHPTPGMYPTPGIRPPPGRPLPVAPTLENLNRLQMEKAIRASLAEPNVVNLTHLPDSLEPAGGGGGGGPVSGTGGGGGGGGGPVSGTGGGGPVSGTGGGGGPVSGTFSKLEGSRIEYVERQESLYCGKHALNNLLGGEYFTTSSGAEPYSREEAIRIGANLSLVNKFNLNRFCKLLAQTPGLIEDPGREPCPDNGDFASNLLVLALRISGFQAGYINIEKRYAAFKSDNTDNLLGYIVNYSYIVE